MSNSNLEKKERAYFSLCFQRGKSIMMTQTARAGSWMIMSFIHTQEAKNENRKWCKAINP